jgi:hypothetical protein
VVALPRNDPFLKNEEDYAKIDALWLANLVDTYNSAMQQLDDALASIDARLTAGGL